MKKINQYTAMFLLSVITIFSVQFIYAQKDVEVNGHDVGSWFSTHWMWVAGGVVLLIILLLASGGSSRRRRKSTTVVKDLDGNVKSVTTTEEV